MFERMDDGAVVDVMTAAGRAQNAQCARELAAIGELYARRAPADDADRFNWAVDGHDNLVAEVAAAMRISRGRAAGRLRYAIALRERLPRVAEVFARGDVDFRLITTVVSRTELIEDAEVIAGLDAALAQHARRWTQFSERKLVEHVDMWVARFDPAGLRVPRQRSDDRYVEFLPAAPGLAGFYAQLHSTDGAALDRALDELADTVCRDDPRTKKQRRADALGALAAGLDGLRCHCGAVDCTAAQRDPNTHVVIHVLAEEAAVNGDSQTPAYLPGFGAVPAPLLRDLAASAKIKSLPIAQAKSEAGYRPSAALAEFVRFRDLTCRFPGCDAPAEVCDIDHTVPFPLGPTHPSNLKLLCRYHHLLKTFYSEWRDLQLPDGTVVWTSPSGRTSTTKPFGAVLFPALAVPTGTLTLPTGMPAPQHNRGIMMPLRRRTRAADRAGRIGWERGINEARMAADPPPF